MPQVTQKTKKSISKRIKVTGTGKLMRHMPGAGHLKSRKSPKRLRNMRKTAEIAPNFTRTLKRLIGF
jgi:large subunit ribosomal protein L35